VPGAATDCGLVLPCFSEVRKIIWVPYANNKRDLGQATGTFAHTAQLNTSFAAGWLQLGWTQMPEPLSIHPSLPITDCSGSSSPSSGPGSSHSPRQQQLTQIND